MPNIHIITDSGARFSNPRLLQQYPVTVMPYKFDIGGKLYREELDITAEEAMRLIKSQNTPPKLIAPSEDEYADIYGRLSRIYDGIISIHSSRELSQSWYNARNAAQRMGDYHIVAIDSRTICAGQGMLVRVAGQAVVDGLGYDQSVQLVRDAVDRVYSVYYVESMEYLYANEIMTEARAILGTMLNIKPFLSIEEGKLTVTEKVRSRGQAVDRMVEFLTEFDDLDDAMIVQNRTHITEQARQLQDRLSLEFPGRHFPYGMYGMALAVLLGGDATGVVVLEKETEGIEDEF